MRKMKAEKLLALCKQRGIKVWAQDDEVMMHGGGFGNFKNSHPFMRLVMIHVDELCVYFGVSKP